MGSEPLKEESAFGFLVSSIIAQGNEAETGLGTLAVNDYYSGLELEGLDELENEGTLG